MHPRTTATATAATAATAATGTENSTAATAAAADDSSAVLLRVERLRHWRAQMRSRRRGRALPHAPMLRRGGKHADGPRTEEDRASSETQRAAIPTSP